MPRPIAALEHDLGSGRIHTDPDVLESYRRDKAPWVEPGMPAALVLAESVEDVRHVLVWARSNRVAVVTRGAGSGLAGGAAAVDGCVVLSLERMNRVLSIDTSNQTALVEPGIINADLKRAAADVGLWFPPDPASYEFSSIGGNVATNAGGLCCVKYGVTGDYVLALEIVMTDGSVVQTGRRTAKGVAGLDITRLLIGSEGTLAVVTKILLQLRLPRRLGPTSLALFPSLQAAGAAVEDIMNHVEPSLLEILDRRCLQAVEEWKSIGLDADADAMLLIQLDEPDAGRMPAIEKMCGSHGASDIATSTDEYQAAELLAIRRLLGPALERLGPALLEDVAVPRSRIAAFLERVIAISAERGVNIATFGHAGDGNLHPTVLYESTPEGRKKAWAAFTDMIAAALDLGGTCTGEHGVGTLKRPFLECEQDQALIQLQRRVKAAFDPVGILNPGKGIG